MKNSPNLFRVSEKGWDKGSLSFELVVREVIITVLRQDRTASDRLLVMRGVLGVVFSESGVIFLIFREYQMSNYVDEGYSQHAPNAGQDGLHLFKSLSG